MEGSSSSSSSAGITTESHRTQSFPSNNSVMDHHHRPLLSSANGADDDDEDDGGGRGSGPSQNDSGPNEVERSPAPTPTPKPPNHSCHHSSSTGPSRSSSSRATTTSTSTGIVFPDHVVVVTNNGSATAGLAAAAAATTLQPFDSPCSITNTASKSPGGGGLGMAAASAALGFPFTAVQWKELERQAMIYKYMIASVPVPSDLLLPADPTAAPSVLLGGSHGGGGSIYNLRYGNRDLEPGRCKRTDGKKWRCSRDVAPHQKYCERHMHRGRPRSRKPVEQLQSSSVSPDDNPNNNISKKSRLHHTSLHPNPTVAQPNNHSSPQFQGTGTIQQLKDPQLLDASIAFNSIFASSCNYKESNRVFGWAVDGEVMAANRVEQESLHLMDTRRREGLAPIRGYIYGTNASTLQQGYGEEGPLNLFSYATEIAYPGGIHSRNDEYYHAFLNSDLIASKQPQIDQHCPPRGFIDAWSNGDLKTIDESSSVPSSKGYGLSPSSLTLSMAMAAGNALDEGMGLDEDSRPRMPTPKDSPVSWLPLIPGGPLAEVLQPNSVACGSNPASPYASNGDSVSPPATTVSSPTGIFQRALFSHSDGSVCNSPTLAASAAPPEVVAFQWLN
ncbi:growth-regulating factor 8-like isoform X1 [Coffea eugenioides]|uniref:growth-regulating factor 8-like isoform X1 n=1 Tax=Coffea eugenioides TaxID=49369 RepID=UPI000F60F517|nr:growth-regulating factor 8-like isoform X1 [Coffea eugenioides]